MRFCKECGAPMYDEDKFCHLCGTKVSEEYVCPYCGAPCELIDGVIKCTECKYSETIDEAIERLEDDIESL